MYAYIYIYIYMYIYIYIYIFITHIYTYRFTRGIVTCNFCFTGHRAVRVEAPERG